MAGTTRQQFPRRVIGWESAIESIVCLVFSLLGVGCLLFGLFLEDMIPFCRPESGEGLGSAESSKIGM